MALNIGVFAIELKAAFNQVLWTTSANAIGDAIDRFVKSGLIITNVTGMMSPPKGGPIPGAGQGTYDQMSGQGTMETPGLAALKADLVNKFNSPSTTWTAFGAQIASAVDIYVKQITITTIVSGGLIGVGVGAAGCIDTSPSYSTFVIDLTRAFTDQTYATTWDGSATQIATAVHTYLTGAIVNTIDAGPSPYPWTGTGVGAMS